MLMMARRTRKREITFSFLLPSLTPGAKKKGKTQNKKKQTAMMPKECRKVGNRGKPGKGILMARGATAW